MLAWDIDISGGKWLRQTSLKLILDDDDEFSHECIFPQEWIGSQAMIYNNPWV